MKETCASVAMLLALGLASCGGLPGLPRTPTLAPQPPTSAVAPNTEPVPASAIPELIPITVYFTDSARYAVGTPPFEAAVTRTIPTTDDLAAAVLDEFFLGPTPEEQARGLERIASGFTGYRDLVIEDGIAHVYLAGPCTSHGATYTIAQPLMANLLQLPNIEYVKIYDEEGTTEVPDGPSNSIPFCLEP
jgi:hypothetical protein